MLKKFIHFFYENFLRYNFLKIPFVWDIYFAQEILESNASLFDETDKNGPECTGIWVEVEWCGSRFGQNGTELTTMVYS